MPSTVTIVSNFPVALMVGLRDEFGLRQFVETGTCCGGTAMLAALAFPRVLTVEFSEVRYVDASNRLRGLPHVSCFHSPSVELLSRMDWQNEPPTLVYLDAHWSGESDDPKINKPLGEELAILGGLYGKHCIVADDVYYEGVLPFITGWEHFGYSWSRDEVHFAVLLPRDTGLTRWLE